VMPTAAPRPDDTQRYLHLPEAPHIYKYVAFKLTGHKSKNVEPRFDFGLISAKSVCALDGMVEACADEWCGKGCAVGKS
jgi:hypothetical protein